MKIIDEIDRIFSTPRNTQSRTNTTSKKRNQALSSTKKRHSVQNINIFQHFFKKTNDENNNNINMSLSGVRPGSNKSRNMKLKAEKSSFYSGIPIKEDQDLFNRNNKKGSKLLSLDYQYSNTNQFSPNQKKRNHKHKHTHADLLHSKAQHIKKFREEVCYSGDNKCIPENGLSSSSSIQNMNRNDKKSSQKNNNANAISNSTHRFMNLFIERIQAITDLSNWINQVKERDKKKRLSLAILNQLSYKPITPLVNSPKKTNKYNTNSIIVEEDGQQSNKASHTENSISRGSKSPDRISPTIKSNKYQKSRNSKDNSPNKSSCVNVSKLEPKGKNQNKHAVIEIKSDNHNNIQTYNASNYLNGLSKCEYVNKKKRSLLCCIPVTHKE